MHKVTSIFSCKKLQQIVILLLPAASIGSKMQLTLSGGECGLYPLPPCLGFAPQSQRVLHPRLQAWPPHGAEE